MKTNLAREREKGSNNVTANKVSNVVCHLNCFFFRLYKEFFHVLTQVMIMIVLSLSD